MKNYLILLLASLFYSFGFTQSLDTIPPNSVMDRSALMNYRKLNPNLNPVILSYKVEEKINMKFGGSITTYNVSSLDLVRTYNLGPNNTRVITPKLGNAKIEVIPPMNIEQLKLFIDTLTISEKPNISYVFVRETKKNYIDINILDTYERTLNKGFKSIEMLQRVGDRRFFEGDYIAASQWYFQLFELTTDLEAEYYYRYAVSLVSISQFKKAKEMMRIYEEKCNR